MTARTKARKRALDVLFECEARRLPLGATLAQRRAAAAEDPREPPISPYTAQLVEGVATHQEHIDAIIAEHSPDWDLDRMPAVDRNLLRIGVLEIVYLDEVPDAVAISEAVQLAAELSTDESPRFVNGVLARVAERRPAQSCPPS